MTFMNMIGLLGGLALFLYGMQMMSSGLEAAAGNKMKQILEKLTSNRILGVLVGAAITAIIQSSSATTVMVVGFVNSGMMTLQQAVWIIMGANIGTTVTGLLISMDVGAIAPLIAFIGVAIIVFIKNEKLYNIANICAGLGILFIGMDMMGAAMKPLGNSEAFVSLLTKFENPVLGILAGMVFTALIQSSSASVGILQTLANSGIIALSSSAFVLFGMNIGTCITALLAAIGTSCNARRTTVVHISFNVIGTVLFTILCLVTPLVSIMENLAPTNPSAQIAYLHTVFNIVTTLCLIPFGTYLAKFANYILKDKQEDEVVDEMYCALNAKQISSETLGITAIGMEGTKKEINRMLEMARKNVHGSYDVFVNKDADLLKELEKREEYVDYLNKEISNYITKAITHESTKGGSQVFNSYFAITSNVERLSDHAMNIAGYSRMIEEKNIRFSDLAKAEIKEMQAVCDELFVTLTATVDDIVKWHGKVAGMEQRIDDLTKQYRNNMFGRIQNGICTDDGSIFFSEMLTDFERIGDHALNIADEYVKISMAK